MASSSSSQRTIKSNKTSKSKAKKDSTPEPTRQRICFIENSIFGSQVINKLMEKNEDFSIIYSPENFPVAGMIRWGDKITIHPSAGSSGIRPTSSPCGMEYPSDSDFDNDDFPSSQQPIVPFAPVLPTEVIKFHDHIAIHYSSETFIKSLLKPYVDIANGTYTDTGYAFMYLHQILVELVNSVFAAVANTDQPAVNHGEQTMFKQVPIHLILVDLEGCLLKVQKEVAQLAKVNTRIIGNIVIPSGVLEDGFTSVVARFPFLHLHRVKNVSEAVEHLETFGQCVCSKLRNEPTLLDSYKKIKLFKKRSAVDADLGDISDATSGDDSGLCDSDTDVNSRNRNRNGTSKSSSNITQMMKLNQQKQLELFKDTYCRCIMSSVSGISEAKACKLMESFNNPRQLYEYLLHQADCSKDPYITSNNNSSSRIASNNNANQLQRTVHPNSHCLETRFHATTKFTKCSREFVKVWYEMKPDAAIDYDTDSSEVSGVEAIAPVSASITTSSNGASDVMSVARKGATTKAKRNKISTSATTTTAAKRVSKKAPAARTTSTSTTTTIELSD